MKRRLFLGLVPAALAASVAHAQPAPADMRHGPHGAEMMARHEAMQRQHLEDLRTVLRLRPDQEPALTAFVEAHRPPMHGPEEGAPEPKPLTTPERLQQMARRDAEMTARHERMRQALTTFYAALTPEQQKVFDALQRLKGPHGHPMGGRMPDHGRMGSGMPGDGHMMRHDPPR
ncbi:MAG TPA: Spy/CpxP family protein refolding chaperone [Phenylobacterium sp.]